MTNVLREWNCISMNKKVFKYLLLLPSFAGVTVFWVVPFFRLLVSSFFQSQRGTFQGFYNYREVLGSQSFRLAAVNTIKFMTFSIPLMLVVSLVLAVFLSERTLLNLWLKEGIILPLVLPAAAVSIFCTVIFDHNGFMNLILKHRIDWLGADTAFGVLLFIYAWKYMGIYMLIWLSGIANVPLELRDEAYLDGAGKGQYVRSILLPNLKQVGFICFVFLFINSFKVFREIYLITGNYPNQKIYMLQHIFNNWFADFAMDKMAAGAVLSAGAIMMCLLVVYIFLYGRQRCERHWGKSKKER